MGMATEQNRLLYEQRVDAPPPVMGSPARRHQFLPTGIGLSVLTDLVTACESYTTLELEVRGKKLFIIARSGDTLGTQIYDSSTQLAPQLLVFVFLRLSSWRSIWAR